MKNLLYLTSSAFLYAFANGFVAIATPQAAMLNHMSSEAIGLLGAAGPVGYALGCIGLGQLFRGVCGKRVLLWGIVVSTVSILGIGYFTTIWPSFLAQLAYGIGQGAVWPFLSAWMLDFQSPSISRTRIFRHYNAGWTSGAAAGMFLAGKLCDWDWIVPCFYAGAAANAVTCVGALLAQPPHSHLENAPESRPATVGEAIGSGGKIGFAIFLAAVLANIGALATRAMVGYNYPELNKALHFGAERMGLFGALTLGGQLAAFLLGSLYEPYLGRRRLYVVMSLIMTAVALAFAYVTNVAVLGAAMLVSGIVLAMAFQAALLAATEWFTDRRNGTTIHEGLVGCAQALTFAAGLTAQLAKNSGVETVAALRLPFLLMPGLIGIFLLIQLIAISGARTRRVLLPPLPLIEARAHATPVASASGRVVVED